MGLTGSHRCEHPDNTRHAPVVPLLAELVSEQHHADLMATPGEKYRLIRNNGLRLDLHPPSRVQQTGNHHHRRRRKNLTEDLTMCATYGVPVGGIDHVDPGSNHVFTGSTEGADGLENDLEATLRLLVRVTRHRFTIGPDGSRSRNNNATAVPHRARKSDKTLIG